MMLVELHSHTTVSDGFQTPMEIVKIAAKAGLAAIAVTDHDTFRGSSLAKRAAKLLGGVAVIPAAEVRSEWGDVVVLCSNDVSDDFPRAIEELREWAVERGCVTIAAHPGYSRYHGIPLDAIRRAASLFDAIEVWNAYTPPHFNFMAIRLAEDLNHTPVSGSDAHVPSMVGVAPALVDSDNESAEGVVEAIAKGRARPTIGFPGLRAILENIGWSLYRIIE